MNFRTLLIGATILGATLATADLAQARDQLKIAGSSTVLPYAQIVAEEFAKANPNFKAPVVESGGSSAGIKQFCQGVGEDQIDIANASRAMKASEFEACAAAGVKEIVQVQFGYDGIVFATDASMGALELTTSDLYLALAAQVPVDGKMVDNPYKTWKEVNAKLPDAPILAFVPGEKHGTREVFETKVLSGGCKDTGAEDIMEKAGLDKKAMEKACWAMRKDGASVDIDGDYTETLARIASNKNAIGVFGLYFYENNTDKLAVATVNGVAPSVETVAEGKYPVSRPLFFYVKKAHIGVIPGLKEYAEFFVSDRMAGMDGMLPENGLVPAPDAELAATQKATADLALFAPKK